MDADRPYNGFREVPHTADIAIELFAPSISELFLFAAKGLYHILGIHTGTGNLKEISLEIEEGDDESLLVSFLNEILYYVNSMAMAAQDLDLKITAHKLKASILMAPIISIKEEIKAATYNDLKIISDKNGINAKVVFDI